MHHRVVIEDVHVALMKAVSLDGGNGSCLRCAMGLVSTGDQENISRSGLNYVCHYMSVCV